MEQKNRLQLIKKKKRKKEKLRDKTRLNSIEFGIKNMILALFSLIIARFKPVKAVFL